MTAVRLGILVLAMSVTAACAQQRSDPRAEMDAATEQLVGVTWRLVEIRSSDPPADTLRPDQPDQYPSYQGPA